MLKIGVIGAGQVAYSHCEEIQSHGGADVTAVADISEERRERLRSRFSLPESYSDPMELIRNTGIDAVTVAIPNALHAEIAVAALESGKHVLLEKPMAMNLAEARRIADAAARNSRILMLGMNQRFVRDAQTIKSVIDFLA